MNISNISIKRPTLVIVIFTIIIFLGFSSYKELNYELLPKFTSPVFTVITIYPGASPSEVENSVTIDLEDVLSSLENIDNIRSISQEAVSMIVVELNQKANIDLALQNAQQKLNTASNILPKECKQPILSKISANDFPIIYFGVTSNLSGTEFYDIIKYKIKPVLNSVEGVAQVNLIGGAEREIKININKDKLEYYNISILQVLQAVQSSNSDFPIGKLKDQSEQLVIRLGAKFEDVEALKNLVITKTADGSLIKLKELAEIIDSEKDPKNLNRINGEPSVGITIQKQGDANAVLVSELMHEKVNQLEKDFEEIGLDFIVAKDTTEFTIEAATSVMDDLRNAIILVTLIMILFLHGLRNGLIVMISVPISLIAAFLGMYILGFSLNLMTLLALSLVIGILVDDAIVVLENVYRHLEMGKTKVKATIDGVKEISLTVISTTLVLVIVFLPVSIVKSIISPILKPFALVIVISTLISLVVAFTVIPLLTSKFSKLETLKEKSLKNRFILWFENQIERFGNFIRSILIWALRHKALTLILVAILFISSISLIAMGLIGSEFIGVGDQGEFILQLELPRNSTLKQTNQATYKVEELIRSKKEVTGIYTTIGGTSDILNIQGGSYKSELNVKLIDKEFRDISSDQFASNLVTEITEKIPGIKIRKALTAITGGADQSPIQIVFKSTNRDSLYKYANLIKDKVSKVPGTIDTKLTIEGYNQEVLVKINKERMAELGLSLNMVGPTMFVAFNGNTDSKYRSGDYEYDINLIFDAFDRRNIDDVRKITFKNFLGKQILLEQFAEVNCSSGTSQLERYNRISSVTLESQVQGRSPGDVGNDIKMLLDPMVLPNQISFTYEGDMKYQADAFGKLGFAFIASIFFVYLIMVALYESFIYPFVVLFSIPLAIIGALFALAFTKGTLSIFTLLGMVMLIGIVAKNAILVVDFTNLLKAKGYSTAKALISATKLRLRPILMTSLSLIIGLFPLALSQGAATEWKSGLAWVIIGGLTSSMLLTLIVVPVMYQIMDNIKIFFQEKVIVKLNKF